VGFRVCYGILFGHYSFYVLIIFGLNDYLLYLQFPYVTSDFNCTVVPVSQSGESAFIINKRKLKILHFFLC
jgi:hypothetical protein